MPQASVSQVQLLGVGTAVPPHAIDQEHAAALAARAFEGRVFREADLLQLFRNTGITTRRTVQPIDWYLRPQDWGARNAAYLDGAETLYEAAARAALDQAGVAPGEVGTVVTVSSTGIATPSLEARLHGRLGLAADVVRAPLFGLGCAGGVSGLALASRLARADPGRPVLLVCVELCSLAVRTDEATKANVVATALFGDGAAAVVLRAGEAEAGERAVTGDSQHLWPDTLDIMGWTVDPGGFGIVLAATLPTFVAQRFHEAAEGFECAHGRGPPARYVCHPGGARVLPALEEVLGLGEGALDIEREVLAEFGNMSAPTVFFVLERALARGPAGPLTLAALGPGFTASFVGLGARAGGAAA